MIRRNEAAGQVFGAVERLIAAHTVRRRHDLVPADT
jgi:hypothetical protein